MRTTKGVAAVALAVATSSCGNSGPFTSVPGVCAGAAREPPHVVVDTAAWTTRHPGAALQLCLDGACQQVTEQPSAPDEVPLYLSGQAVDQPLTVAVRATQGPVTVLDTSTTVRLQHLQVGGDGPCGDFSQWAADVTLDSNGRLHTVRLPRPANATASVHPSSD